MSKLIARWQPATHHGDLPVPIELWRLTDEQPAIELLRYVDWWTDATRRWEDANAGKLAIFVLCPTSSGLLRRKGMVGCYPLIISTRYPPTWLQIPYNLYWPERRRWPGHKGWRDTWTATDRRMARRVLWALQHVVGRPPLSRATLPYQFIAGLGVRPSRFEDEDGRG